MKRAIGLTFFVLYTPVAGWVVSALLAPVQGEPSGGAALSVLWPLVLVQLFAAAYLAGRVWKAEERS